MTSIEQQVEQVAMDLMRARERFTPWQVTQKLRATNAGVVYYTAVCSTLRRLYRAGAMEGYTETLNKESCTYHPVGTTPVGVVDKVMEAGRAVLDGLIVALKGPGG